MAVGSIKSGAQGFRGEYGLGGGISPRTMNGREAASQSWVAGAVLIRSSGLLAEAAADPVANIVGVAKGAASTTTNNVVEYWPAVGVVFSATFEDESNEDHALVIANIFTDYAIQLDTDGIFYIDENDTTNTAVMIMQAVNDTDIDDAKVRARVLCVFIQDIVAQDT